MNKRDKRVFSKILKYCGEVSKTHGGRRAIGCPPYPASPAVIRDFIHANKAGPSMVPSAT